MTIRAERDKIGVWELKDPSAAFLGLIRSIARLSEIQITWYSLVSDAQSNLVEYSHNTMLYLNHIIIQRSEAMQNRKRGGRMGKYSKSLVQRMKGIYDG